MTYEIINNGAAIKCLVCGMTSYNTNDIEQKYCGHCHQFHEFLEIQHKNEDELRKLRTFRTAFKKFFK